MATVLRTYNMTETNAWYAQVRGDDGVVREIKVRQATKPSNLVFRNLSAASEQAEAEAIGRQPETCPACGQALVAKPVPEPIPEPVEEPHG